MRRLGLAALIGSGSALLVYLAGLTAAMGAHPGWGFQLMLSAAILGPFLSTVLLHVDHVQRTLGLSLLVIAAFATADYGRNQFVASFGEDGVAGQMWFYGWHAFGVLLAAHITSSTYHYIAVTSR